MPWRRERLPTPVLWPGEFHGLCSPCGRKESDMTERLSLSSLRARVLKVGLYTPGVFLATFILAGKGWFVVLECWLAEDLGKYCWKFSVTYIYKGIRRIPVPCVSSVCSLCVRLPRKKKMCSVYRKCCIFCTPRHKWYWVALRMNRGGVCHGAENVCLCRSLPCLLQVCQTKKQGCVIVDSISRGPYSCFIKNKIHHFIEHCFFPK